MKILHSLKQKGFRITKPREEIHTVLLKAQSPLSVQEIFEILQKKNISIDIASIYRSLELFVEMKIAYVIEFGEDKKRYELVDENNHHHHLICNNCGAIKDIALDEKKFINEVVKKTDFQIDHHHLEFFGICSNCK